MATEMVEIEGIFEWAKIFEHNRDRRYSEDTDGEYQISIIMDEANAKKLKAAGCQKKMTADPDGRGTVVRLTRPHAAANAWAGGAPKVAGPDGTAWDVESDGTIGNGSTGRVLAAIFETKTGRKGTRLEAVQVIDHVEYVNPDGDDAPKKGAAASFFKDYTGGNSAPAPKPAAKADSVAEDVIPF
jgi:hypothetical protein